MFVTYQKVAFYFLNRNLFIEIFLENYKNVLIFFLKYIKYTYLYYEKNDI